MKANEALKQIMDAEKLRRVDIAEKAGMQPNELSRYLNGRRDLMGERLMHLVRALPLKAQVEFWMMMREAEEPRDELQAAS
jgi:transcriptional regulator with XRE-family HTH domain